MRKTGTGLHVLSREQTACMRIWPQRASTLRAHTGHKPISQWKQPPSSCMFLLHVKKHGRPIMSSEKRKLTGHMIMYHERPARANQNYTRANLSGSSWQKRGTRDYGGPPPGADPSRVHVASDRKCLCVPILRDRSVRSFLAPIFLRVKTPTRTP